MLPRFNNTGENAILNSHEKGPATPEQLKTLIEKSLDADKAEEITTIDLHGQTAIADYMIVASGRSSRQVSAIAKKLVERLKARGVEHIHTEGMEQSNWVIVDAGDIVVHIFRPEVREFYKIEKMWQQYPHLMDTKLAHGAPA